MLKQTLLSNDIVVVCDGHINSEIQAVIDEVKNRYPNLINQVQLDKNVGLGLALNEGLKACKNELVARMDADDYSLPNRCEEQIKMFRDDPDLDVVGCQVKEFVDSIDNIVGKRDVPCDNDAIYKYCRRRDPFNHPTVMYKKSKVLRYGPYGDYRKNQDTDLWIKLLSNGCKCANHKDYLLLFRFDERTYKKRKSLVNTKLLIQIRKNAWKTGFCSWWDYIVVKNIQIFIHVMPLWVQKAIYKKLHRNK